MSTKRRRKKSPARAFLEGLNEGPLTLGQLLVSIREGEGMTQRAFAKQLDVPVSHLCDVEKGRKGVSPERAARWARAVGHAEVQFVRLALQDQLREAGLDMTVRIDAA